MIWAIFAALSLLAVAFLALSARASKEQVMTEPNSARDILIDQLSEIDRDAERSLISDAEAKAARILSLIHI